MGRNEDLRRSLEAQFGEAPVAIQRPGKFEGEPLATPYLWGLAMDGMADRDNGEVFGFDLDTELRETLAALGWKAGRRRTVKVWEDGSGFVRIV